MATPSNDSPKRDLAAHLKAQNWPRVRADILRFACRYARSRQDAEDLVQEALRRAFEPDGDPWDPDVRPAEQVVATGETIEEIRKARKRVQRAIESVLPSPQQAPPAPARDLRDIGGEEEAQ